MEKKVYAKRTIDDTVKMLLEYQQKGEDVYCEFNGHILHSNDITVDKAYLEITGETKEEFEKGKQEILEKAREKSNNYLSKKEENANRWYIQGKNYIYPERDREWLEFCQVEAEDIVYGDSIIEYVLDLMRQLATNNNIYWIADNFNKDENMSGIAAIIIESMVLKFSKKGVEFAKLVDSNSSMRPEKWQKDIEQTIKENESFAKDEEQEVEIRGNLEDFVNQLLEYTKRGQNVYARFNNHILHSKGLTIDNAYLEVLNETKEEHDKNKKAYLEREKKEDDEFLAKKDENIKTWFIEGQNYIYPERETEWLEFCKEQASETVYKGSLVKEVLRIMRLLENTNDIAYLVDEFNHNPSYSGAAANYIQNLLLHFSKRGPEFVREFIKGNEEHFKELITQINMIEEQNKAFAETEEFKKQVK